jgi:hypothetical protein
VLGLAIGGFAGHGVVLQDPGSDVVQGNYIGLQADGSTVAGNGLNGIFVNGTFNNTIGGTVAEAGNVISANGQDGVSLTGSAATGNLVQGNLVGVGSDGVTPLGNAVDGVAIVGGAHDNMVGGLATGAGNTIAYSGNDGVLVDTGKGNAILSNRIFASGNLGIELLNGGNNNQIAPTLASAPRDGPKVVIQGIFRGAANSTFTLQFFS